MYCLNVYRIKGLVVDATVPNARIILVPNPLAFEGYNSLIYKPNIAKYIAIKNLAIHTNTTPNINYLQKWQSLGSFKNIIINVITPLTAKDIKPQSFLGIF